MLNIPVVYKEGAHMLPRCRENLLLFTFPSFEKIKAITHGYTSRLGGVSTGDRAYMNLTWSREKDPGVIKENAKILGDFAGFDYKRAVSVSQRHTDRVAEAGRERAGEGILFAPKAEGADALVSNQPGITLMIQTADCVPLYFYDPEHRAVGLAHAGWRGTAAQIGPKTVFMMQKLYASRPGKILAGIGPSICADCYEVDDAVYAPFAEIFSGEELSKIFSPAKSQKSGKYQCSLWEANRLQLLRAGLLEHQIALPGLCTACNPRVLFSHRVMENRRGNGCAFLGIRA